MARRQPWLRMADGLEFELTQLREEGREVAPEFAKALEAVAAMPDGEEKDALAKELFLQAQRLPYTAGENAEPDDLEGIVAAGEGTGEKIPYAAEELEDRVYGAWLGRCAGCLLGKPVEGWRTPELHRFLKVTGNYPIRTYLRAGVTEEQKKEIGFDFGHHNSFIDQVSGMPEDDDTNYTVIALKLLETCGRGFTPADCAENWLANLPLLHLCTAERIAYRNLVMSIEPPKSASFCNGYREWIGAQIRADLFGYINPGDTRTAAEMAWRDASISHVKNGIYGEMWVAAMLAAAAVCDDIPQVIRMGLREIPKNSRLHAAVCDVLAKYDAGASAEECFAMITTRWDEYNGHHWCHTISNAQIVAAALLYGGADLGKTLSLAVMPGFDTDCNGATSGSVLGMMLGARALPAEWTEPLHDTLFSGVDGFGQVRISDMAKRTCALVEQ